MYKGPMGKPNVGEDWGWREEKWWGGKWRQLYLNNNKTKLKEKVDTERKNPDLQAITNQEQATKTNKKSSPPWHLSSFAKGLLHVCKMSQRCVPVTFLHHFSHSATWVSLPFWSRQRSTAMVRTEQGQHSLHSGHTNGLRAPRGLLSQKAWNRPPRIMTQVCLWGLALDTSFVRAIKIASISVSFQTPSAGFSRNWWSCLAHPLHLPIALLF